VGVEWCYGNKEKKYVDLVVHGESKGDSAMAKTVGKTAAIGTMMILDGKIQQKGMLIPLEKQIYEPMLRELANEGIKSSTVIESEVKYEKPSGHHLETLYE
jgi:saccharopine dehydrogenase-like NADP-dependent oxidoreductase